MWIGIQFGIKLVYGHVTWAHLSFDRNKIAVIFPSFFLFVLFFLSTRFPFLCERLVKDYHISSHSARSAVFRDQSYCKGRLNHFKPFVRCERGRQRASTQII